MLRQFRRFRAFYSDLRRRDPLRRLSLRLLLRKTEDRDVVLRDRRRFRGDDPRRGRVAFGLGVFPPAEPLLRSRYRSSDDPALPCRLATRRRGVARPVSARAVPCGLPCRLRRSDLLRAGMGGVPRDGARRLLPVLEQPRHLPDDLASRRVLLREGEPRPNRRPRRAVPRAPVLQQPRRALFRVGGVLLPSRILLLLSVGSVPACVRTLCTPRAPTATIRWP